MARLIGTFGALSWLVGLMVLLAFGGFWPLMAWSVMRNMKRIRLQLERLNTNLESGGMNLRLTLDQASSSIVGASQTRVGAGPLKL